MAELATVRIHRQQQWIGLGLVVVVEVDGGEVGRLRNGKNLVTSVASGRHNFRLRHWSATSEPLELELAPGKDVRLEATFETRNGLTYQLVMVPTAVGGAESEIVVLGATEMYRSEEPIGTEEKRIKNASGARVTRTMRVTMEWSRTISLHREFEREDFADTAVGPAWLQFRSGVKQHLGRIYEINQNRREEFAEEFCVEVGPGADVTVVLAWKRLWQNGVAHVVYRGRPVDIPFQVAVGITFDQSLV